LHNNIFELKVHSKSKFILIQWLGEEDWIKSIYTKYITYSSLTTIVLHVYDSWNITKNKKIEKIMQFSSIKSPPFWYGNGIFPKRYYYAFIIKQMQKTHFVNEISSKNFKFLNFLRFNWSISISYTIKKFTQESHPQP
jgi:hypothetical protein